MRPYGMTRRNHADDDVAGCIENGRATRVGHLPRHGGDAPTFRALRGGRKAAVRRHTKRAARALCNDQD